MNGERRFATEFSRREDFFGASNRVFVVKLYSKKVAVIFPADSCFVIFINKDVKRRCMNKRCFCTNMYERISFYEVVTNPRISFDDNREG